MPRLSIFHNQCFHNSSLIFPLTMEKKKKQKSLVLKLNRLVFLHVWSISLSLH